VFDSTSENEIANRYQNSSLLNWWDWHRLVLFTGSKHKQWTSGLAWNQSSRWESRVLNRHSLTPTDH